MARNRTTLAALAASTLLLLPAVAGAARGPVVQGVAPHRAPSTGGTTVTVTGADFQPGARVVFGSVPATRVTYVSAFELRAVTPLAARGVVGVTVANPDGKSATLPAAFELLYDGDGLFTLPALRVPPDADPTRRVLLGDLDADGDLDVFAANADRDTLYLNEGDGRFTDVTATHLPVFADRSNDAALGDLDGDGDLDLVTANGFWYSYAWGGQQVRAYRNDGSGRFSDASTEFLPPDLSAAATGVALGDQDGDGAVDHIALATRGQRNYAGAQNRLYRRDATGFFQDASSLLPQVSDQSYGAALGDVDGDGLLDVVFASTDEHRMPQPWVRLYLQRADGTFADVSSSHLPAPSNYNFAVRLLDVDGDRDLDLALASYAVLEGGIAGVPSSLWINDGHGLFADATGAAFPAGARNAYSVEGWDADGDGTVDLLAYSADRAGTVLYRNDGAGIFAEVSDLLPSPNPGGGSVAFGDVTGDGVVDLFLGLDGQQNRLLVGTAAGRFVDVTMEGQPTAMGSFGATFADLDRDGDQDVVVSAWAYPNQLFLNDGAGWFTDATGTSLPDPALAEPTLDVEAGDLDGDGFPDLVFANLGTGNRLYLNNGDGTFRDGSAVFPPGYQESWDVDLADVDGDGRLDVFFSVIGSWPRSRLYLNLGGGAYADVTFTHIADVPGTYHSELGDVDGDGDPDLVVALYGTGLRLFLNDGRGHFADASTTGFPSSLAWGFDVQLADVEGDGDLDVFATQDGLYLNDGRGVFTPAPDRVPAQLTSRDHAEFGDLNGDGFVDLYSPPRLFLNDGSGRFVDQTAADMPALSEAGYDAQFADVDGDADLDLLTVNYSHCRLYLNGRHPDLAPPTAPAGLTAVAGSFHRVDLAWEASTDDVWVTGYAVLRDGAEVGTTVATSFSVDGLAEATSACFAVVAFDRAGHRSDPSVPACVTTPLAPRMFVRSISMAARLTGPTERLEASVVVARGDGSVVGGARVTGVFTLPGGAAVTAAGTTDAAGAAVLAHFNARSLLPAGSYAFAVTGVSEPDHVYAPQQNVETTEVFVKY